MTSSQTGAHASLTGKVAIVTGASRGIGRAIASRLGAAGARLALTARTRASLEDVCTVLRRDGVEVRGVAAPDGDTERVAAAAIESFGRIDIVINNAGTARRGLFTELTDSDWSDGYAVKLFGAVRLCRASWPQLKANSGAVINIAGAGGRTPDALFTIGGSVNAAVMAFTKALAQQGIIDGVQVNAINPGLIRTDRLERRLAEASRSLGVSVAEAEQRMIAEHKVARFGTPEEIAELVAYVLSVPGKLLQGALIDADAGYTKGI